MDRASSKRVAVFLAHWELISVLSNTIKLLHDQAYDIDLFLYRNHIFVEMDSLRQRSGVQIYDLGPAAASTALQAKSNTRNGFTQRLKKLLPSSRRFLNVLIARARLALWEIRHAYWHLRGSEKGLIPATLVAQALKLMEGKHYRCLVGIEKNGLVWAGQVAERLHVPFFYYSLELYNEDYVRLGLLKSFSFRHLWWAERRYHRKAAATIVQDLERAQVLLEGNGVPMSGATIAYLPVSVLGRPCTKRSSFLHDMLGIPRERRIVLYFGHIRERRYALDLARVAQEAAEDWILVMHGFSDPDTIEKIKNINVNKRVVLSLETVPSDRIQEVISSADIGLAMYSPLTQNERLTAFSSEKMALYMQCGVPFIAFDYPGYQRLAKEDRCGVVVNSISELPEAVSTILGSYEEFRQQAYRAFGKYYDFAANFGGVRNAFELLCNSVPES